MTDVQKAIEQLGRGHGDGDGARSFSFASTRDDRDTDTEFEASDVDGADGGEGWHKDARKRLAEKARKAVEEAEKLEALMGGLGMAGRQSRDVAPPIEVEMSDESDPEEDHEDFTRSRDHPYIPEEDEDAETDLVATHGREVSGGETTVKTATATRSTFPALQYPPVPYADIPTPATVEEKHSSGQLSLPTPVSPSSFTRDSPSPLLEPQRASTPLRESMIALPSPTYSFTNFRASGSAPQSKRSSLGASPLIQAPVAQRASLPPPAEEKKEKSQPSDWTVDDVVDWLKTKGFDESVCEKFIEQEITGDVLLALDVNLLKSEIGIMAFGKRLRIANAITDLKRPPSITYSDHPEPSPSSLMMPMPSQYTHHSQGHSRNQSQSQSHHSYPGVSGHTYSQSLQSSLGSPLGYPGGGSMLVGAMGPESPQHAGDVSGSPITRNGDGGSDGSNAGDESAVIVGLGIGLPTAANGKGMGRPAHLMLSPSDGALSASARAVTSTNIPEEGEEDRGHMSEILTPAIERTRSCAQYASSHLRQPKDKDTGSVRSRHRSKRSIDSTRPTSIFGASFGGSLGKSRKPPPASEDAPAEKGSMFSLPKLHGSVSRKASSTNANRLASPPGSPSKPKEAKEKPNMAKEKPNVTKEKIKEVKEMPATLKEKEGRDPALLRKRTTSTPTSATETRAATNGLSSPLKQGTSILEQIGEPDHNGWMRKKGDRYNTWRLRYFVLKGPHLYCLKSNDKTETKIKGYIHIVGYKVTVDESVDPGRYGFRIDHDHDKTHYFSSDEKSIVREWMKAIMKATIGRDYTKPVVSSCNIPTIPLVVAQAMNPAPRPPSPTARDATQKALRRENPNQLSSRDARVLMGLPNGESGDKERTRLDSFFSNTSINTSDASTAVQTPQTAKSAPPRPSREMRHSSQPSVAIDDGLVEWANLHLPAALRVTDPMGSIYSGLALLRLAESVKGYPSSPPVPDSAFPSDPNDDKLDGLFKLFDFLLDNDVKMGSVSINDVRQGKREKIVQLLRALKAWEDKRNAIVQGIGKTSVQVGAFMAPMNATWTG
ncbi:hypothetical protein BD779DRAFT_1532251 [Infundibulicybe gibba]|nr:hypothetical protein BD779DRAFT_1532251 [Infundibulicybe gibba]